MHSLAVIKQMNEDASNIIEQPEIVQYNEEELSVHNYFKNNQIYAKKEGSE